MNSTKVLQVNNISIDVIRKNIKNIHLAVYPPDARVKISAPFKYDDETIKLFAISKWAWIKDNIKIIKNQTRIPPKEYISGESHYLFGKRYILKVIEGKKSSIDMVGANKIVLTIRKNVTQESKKRIIETWYRERLAKKLDVLIPRWEEKTGLKINSWQIKKMQTRWGTCNINKKIIYLNLELAKQKIKNIEYVILHELSHLIERTHNRKFISHLETYMPNWRLYRKELNSVTFEG